MARADALEPFRRGQEAEGRRHWLGAVEAYLEAITAYPYDIDYHSRLANVLRKLGYFEEAYHVYEVILALGADRSATLSVMAHDAALACNWELRRKAETALHEEMANGDNHAGPFQLLGIQAPLDLLHQWLDKHMEGLRAQVLAADLAALNDHVIKT